MLLRAIIGFCLLGITSSVFAQQDTTRYSLLLDQLHRFSLSGYGAMNYYAFTWETDTAKRNAIDNERFILNLSYRWTDNISLSTEIEFEHGGTGSSVEFDRFEEFGEFEFDISKGGEVLLEQMYLSFRLFGSSYLKVGRVKVPFGLFFSRDEPTDYLTATNSEMESYLLPENWTENGFLWSKDRGNGHWSYHIALVNGLDNSAFNSANWIKRGNQRRFEMVNAENFAICARLDYHLADRLSVGLSAYGSRTATDNRPKPDLPVNTPIGIGELHLQYQHGCWLINSMAMIGALGNSEALSNQNRNLSNNLNVKRTPVGGAALGAFAELGLIVWGKQGIWKNKKNAMLAVYGRYDYYDSMLSTEGVIFNNPRWARQSATIGAVYKIIKQVHLKAQYTMREVGAPAPTSIDGGTSENTFTTGFAFEF